MSASHREDVSGIRDVKFYVDIPDASFRSQKK